MSRLQKVSAEHLVDDLSHALDRWMGWAPTAELSLHRRFLVTWAMMYFGSLAVYFAVAGLISWLCFTFSGTVFYPKAI